MNEALEKYVQLKQQIDELQKQLDEIKEDALKSVKEAGGKVESDVATASCRSRVSWEYSTAVGEAQDKLKALKKDEEKSGAATRKESEYLMLKFK
jgi:hypothetical protein